jgi:hypothetical protein
MVKKTFKMDDLPVRHTTVADLPAKGVLGHEAIAAGVTGPEIADDVIGEKPPSPAGSWLLRMTIIWMRPSQVANCRVQPHFPQRFGSVRGKLLVEGSFRYQMLPRPRHCERRSLKSAVKNPPFPAGFLQFPKSVAAIL